ncbi:hypothetical protein [[Mycobacterium] nativiensis]|uniref:Uncharacterized protein n=1 Tax=[Mycobacterium] nativiensis TaxID=2855503 RepID=A0ABU5XYF9_9MYCO|nr:hypothetical protein [Mycolicibacter sp. MYC340]MEB3033031.1 hypothetical protein [Mycolicibacter sp. MYC340]
MPNSAAAYAPFPDPGLRYRLDVIALDVAGLVASAGGWLYHRVATGWDVTVAVPKQQNLRPLQILGVRTVDLEAELSAPAGAPAGQCLAVVAEATVTDARIRQRVQLALRRSLTEVVVWGESWPLDRRLHTVRHVPTVAGRAFKRQALLAADTQIDTRAGGPELFRSDQKRSSAADSDLVPVH